jgi:hypothetical protein
MDSNIERLPDPDVAALNEARAHLMSAALLLIPVAVRAEQRQRVREKTAAKRKGPPPNSWEATRTQNGPALEREDRLTG